MATLIICEKNNAAQRVASILAKGKYSKTFMNRVPVFRFPWNNTEGIVVGLRGHILNFDYPKEFKNWNIDDLERLVATPPVKYTTATWIMNTLQDLAKQIDTVIVATDFDREGELIGAEAISVMNMKPDIKILRARFSALTGPEINGAFENLIELDHNLAKAAEARQIVDLAWGAVLTRFMSTSTGKLGADFLSVGRVQSPSLAIIVNREKEIENFDPQPFWEVLADLEKEKHFFAKHAHGLFWEKEEADKVFEVVKDAKVAKVIESESKAVPDRPPAPFNTTVFLAEASKMGLSASRAMAIAERLYNDGLLSYPRTDNTVYPRTLPIRHILEKLTKSDLGKEAAEILAQEKLRPSRGKMQTTDHPPIHPVGAATKAKLKGDDWRIYELVVRRFLATLAPDAIIERGNALFDINGEQFQAAGHETLEKGWQVYYPYFKFKDIFIPKMEKGEEISILKVRGREGKTEPPRRYSQGTLIREMEKLGLGTKSTRHEIVQKLYDRSYVQGSQMRPTIAGTVIVETLEDNAEMIVKPDMTSQLEKDMTQIAEGKIDQKKVVTESQEMLASSLKVLFEHKENIHKEVNEALKNQNQMGQCPKCGKGNLLIRKSKRGKRFMACDAYPDCENTYPIPQYGAITPHKEPCKVCEGPIVKVVMSRRKPQEICLDIDCKANKERREKYAKYKASLTESKTPAKKPAKKSAKKPAKK